MTSLRDLYRSDWMKPLSIIDASLPLGLRNIINDNAGEIYSLKTSHDTVRKQDAVQYGTWVFREMVKKRLEGVLCTQSALFKL